MQRPHLGHGAQPDIDQQHLLPEQHHAAAAAIVAGVAVLELIDAPQHQLAVVIARRLQGGNRHGVVEQLQVVGCASPARRADAGVARFQAVEPEPGEAAQHGQADEFERRHALPG